MRLETFARARGEEKSNIPRHSYWDGTVRDCQGAQGWQGIGLSRASRVTKLDRATLVGTFGVTPEGKISICGPLFSFVLLLDLFLAMHGREEGYLIVACTVITDVPEAVGP
jgi:hypothetical protein